MYRFFVETDQLNETTAYICGDDVNHIQNVLRMDIGDRLLLTDGTGKDYVCHIEVFGDEQVDVIVDEIRQVSTELPSKVTLFQALPKADKMELIIQKAVELGAYQVVPVKTKRCVVKLDDKKAEKKIVRWQGIAEAAAKQSGRGIVPQVQPVISFVEALQQAKAMEMAMIPYELCESMKETVEVIQKAALSESVGIFIGPEGGFEQGEIAKAMEQGVIPISLGKRILRTETAGLTTLSVLMFMMEANACQ